MKRFIFKLFTKELNTGSVFWKMNTKVFYFLYRKLHNQKNLVKKNIEIHNCCVDKRCFIMGNGPSINKLNLENFSNEDVFTVNRMMLHPDFDKLKSNYHIFADVEFFKELDENSESSLEHYNTVKKILQKESMTLFVPTNAEKKIKSYGIDSGAKVRYFFQWDYYKKITDIDVSRVIPAFNKVIHYAIVLAIYMGYKDIYILGCEETGIMTYINLAMYGDSEDDHFYKSGNENKNIWREQLKNNGLAWEFEQEAEVLKGYKALANYCKRNKINIYNLTENSLIDSIEKKRLGEVIGK